MERLTSLRPAVLPAALGTRRNLRRAVLPAALGTNRRPVFAHISCLSRARLKIAHREDEFFNALQGEQGYPWVVASPPAASALEDSLAIWHSSCMALDRERSGEEDETLFFISVAYHG